MYISMYVCMPTCLDVVKQYLRLLQIKGTLGI